MPSAVLCALSKRLWGGPPGPLGSPRTRLTPTANRPGKGHATPPIPPNRKSATQLSSTSYTRPPEPSHPCEAATCYPPPTANEDRRDSCSTRRRVPPRRQHPTP